MRICMQTTDAFIIIVQQALVNRTTSGISPFAPSKHDRSKTSKDIVFDVLIQPDPLVRDGTGSSGALRPNCGFTLKLAFPVCKRPPHH